MTPRILEITRYPVKSMAGEHRTTAEIDWQGIEGDRQYAFVRRGNATRFPWLTGRDYSGLVRYRPRYDDPEQPRTSAVMVETPGGGRLRLGDPALREDIEAGSGLAADLLQLGTGAYDAMPVSVVATASLARLDRLHGGSLDRRRFRANIVIESDLYEDAWQGRRLRLGSGDDAAVLLLAAPAPRCAMVTIDPDTGTRDPRVLRTVARELGNALTMYASVARPGWVREGDAVTVLD